MPVLRHAPALPGWESKAVSPYYDPRDIACEHKLGVTLGMGMTEKQGGSDVRANRTVATPLGAEGEYRLVGHKWFFSAPMSDAFLVLAQAPGGMSCFLMPRWRTITIEFPAGGREVRLPDGAVRPLPATIDIEDDGRLKLKVINRDTIPHQAGVLGVSANDSATVGAEYCTGGARTIVLQ